MTIASRVCKHFHLQGHIVKSLQARYRELRRNQVEKSTLPANVRIEYSFKSCSATASSGPKCKKVKLDELPTGEDVISFSRHNQHLKAENSKPHPNKAVVQELMKVTFEMRCQDIVNNSRHLKQLLEVYPFLRSPDEVSEGHCMYMHIAIMIFLLYSFFMNLLRLSIFQISQISRKNLELCGEANWRSFFSLQERAHQLRCRSW